MKWVSTYSSWKKRFAFFPVTVTNGPVKETVWLEGYWIRFEGHAYNMSLQSEMPVA